MANNRLHIICGNCGCNDMFAAQIDNEGRDIGDKQFPEVFIQCANCSTIHAISELMSLSVYDPEAERRRKDKIKKLYAITHQACITAGFFIRKCYGEIFVMSNKKKTPLANYDERGLY